MSDLPVPSCQIVWTFQGQYKSVLTCPQPECGRVSVTFDPFMYLSLPIPVTNNRTVLVTYFDSDGRPPIK